jgi:hypothetical protein
VEESLSDTLPPERLLECWAKMNLGEIVLARMWSTGRWRREWNFFPTFSVFRQIPYLADSGNPERFSRPVGERIQQVAMKFPWQVQQGLFSKNGESLGGIKCLGGVTS